MNFEKLQAGAIRAKRIGRATIIGLCAIVIVLALSTFDFGTVDAEALSALTVQGQARLDADINKTYQEIQGLKSELSYKERVYCYMIKQSANNKLSLMTEEEIKSTKLSVRISELQQKSNANCEGF